MCRESKVSTTGRWDRQGPIMALMVDTLQIRHVAQDMRVRRNHMD